MKSRLMACTYNSCSVLNPKQQFCGSSPLFLHTHTHTHSCFSPVRSPLRPWRLDDRHTAPALMPPALRGLGHGPTRHSSAIARHSAFSRVKSRPGLKAPYRLTIVTKRGCQLYSVTCTPGIRGSRHIPISSSASSCVRPTRCGWCLTDCPYTIACLNCSLIER